MKKIIIATALAFLLVQVRAAYYVSSNEVVAIFYALGGGTNGGSGLGYGIPTNSPNIYWTSNVFRSIWKTNANFTSGQVGLASSNAYVSQITASNSSASSAITWTFPMTAYSISMRTNVVSATIPASSALDLQFYFDRTNYFVVDKGPNDPFLSEMVLIGGSYYPSNTWSLSTVTNGMANKSFSIVSSNALTLVVVYPSNGVTFLKQIFP